MLRAGKFDTERAMLLWQFRSRTATDLRANKQVLAANKLGVVLDGIYRNRRLRPAYNKLAEGVVLTKMQRRICLRLSSVYYDKLKRYF